MRTPLQYRQATALIVNFFWTMAEQKKRRPSHVAVRAVRSTGQDKQPIRFSKRRDISQQAALPPYISGADYWAAAEPPG